MKSDPAIHHRHSLRLKGYDYSHAGAFFVTICLQHRACLLGEIVDGMMRLNNAGQMVNTVLDEIPSHYPGADIDAFVAMPNHIHGIIVIGQPSEIGQPQGVAPTGVSLSDVVHRFKTMTTKRYMDGVKQKGWVPFDGKLWQRNYYEHIVRNERDLSLVREYIGNNPAQWELDSLHPSQTLNPP